MTLPNSLKSLTCLHQRVKGVEEGGNRIDEVCNVEPGLGDARRDVESEEAGVGLVRLLLPEVEEGEEGRAAGAVVASWRGGEGEGNGRGVGRERGWIERKRGMGEMGERVRGENGEKKREVESGVESEM